MVKKCLCMVVTVLLSVSLISTFECQADYSLEDITEKVKIKKIKNPDYQIVKKSSLKVNIKNTSGERLIGPIRLVIESISDDAVDVVNFDGVDSMGKPYFEFLSANEVLDKKKKTIKKDISFTNPMKEHFSIIASVQGRVLIVADEIPPEGGEINLGALGGIIHKATLTIPDGALSESTRIEVTKSYQYPPVPYNVDLLSNVTGFQPAGLSFSQPAILTLYYSDDNSDGIIDGTGFQEEDLIAWLHEDSSIKWGEAPFNFHDTENNFIRVEIAHFSEIALLIPTGATSEFHSFSDKKEWKHYWRPSTYSHGVAGNNWLEKLIGTSKVSKDGYLTLNATIKKKGIRQGSEIYIRKPYPNQGTFAARVRYNGESEQGHSTIKAFFTYQPYDNFIDIGARMEHNFEAITEEFHPWHAWNPDPSNPVIYNEPAMTNTTHYGTNNRFMLPFMTIQTDQWYTLIVSSERNGSCSSEPDHTCYESQYWLIPENGSPMFSGSTSTEHHIDLEWLHAVFNIWWLDPANEDNKDLNPDHVDDPDYPDFPDYNPTIFNDQSMDIDWFYYTEDQRSVDTPSKALEIHYKGVCENAFIEGRSAPDEICGDGVDNDCDGEVDEGC